MPLATYSGGCHCGAVAFEVDAAAELEVHRCNCSICDMTGFLHLIVPRDQFRLLQGSDAITTYTFNTGVAQHYFCKNCGVKSFYIPRSNPDGISVNAHCLKLDEAQKPTIIEFDGQNWEDNASDLEHLA
ncbi:MAG: GFA family protein [Pseudomonadota bacterium]